MDYAAIIKDRVSVSELVSFYGLKKGRGGFVPCPFHKEKTASLKLYDRTKTYHCFGCGAHGDVVDFVQNYFGLSLKEAQSKINDDFRLGLPINEPVDDEKRRQMQREADERRRQREAARMERDRLCKAYDDALAEWIRLDRQRRQYAPETLSEPFHERYAEAVRRIPYAGYLLDDAEIALYLFDRKQTL